MREDWISCLYEDLLDYEQPTEYIVESTDYHDSYPTPVLTAGKSFLKGYTNETHGVFNSLPVIIFDDFTTATQYVNFTFKVKSSAMKILIPRSPLVNLPFVFYGMQVNKVRSDTHKRYWISVYAKMEAPLPPLPEQRAIVSRIEELFSAVDSGVGSLRQAQAQLKVYRQAVLKKAFEGELTKEWRDGGGVGGGVGRDAINRVSTGATHADGGRDAVNRVSTVGNPETIDGPFKIPDSWRMVKTGSVMPDINNGYTPTSEHLSTGSGDVPFIKVYNLNFDGTYDYKDQTFIPKSIHDTKLKRSLCRPKDVLISIVGPPLGKVTIVPDDHPEWNINQAIVRFRPTADVLPKYLAYYHQNPITINWLEGTSKATAGQYNVKVTTCREMPFPLCSPEEQHQVVQEIEKRLSVCDSLEAAITDSLRKAEALRQSILKKAFAGQLLTEAELAACRQEKDWEPAGVLLERIKKEKNGKKK
jgi:type I restriction enzyme, S subunit